MKKLLLIFYFFVSITFLQAQISISGTVVDLDGNKLEGASVYLNNTSLGTTTNQEGEFYLNLPKGQFTLVVSYIGFRSERYDLNTGQYSKPITFKLIPKTSMLDEVVIDPKKKITPRKRKNYLKQFRKEFLGTSKFAKTCKILNEKVLEFYFDEETQTLDVSTSEPLIIVNKSLGYTITYDLVQFELSPSDLTYLGNVRYENMTGKDRKKRRWNKNRKKAYRGSQMHFLRAVAKNKMMREGFLVDLIQRKPNPNRPSEEEIEKAKDVLKKFIKAPVSSYQKQLVSDEEINKARSIIRRAQLDPYIERTIQRNLKPYQYTLENQDKIYLMFSDHLKVSYLRELPDRNFTRKRGYAKYQVSLIKLHKEEVEIDKIGTLREPLDVLLMGYWGFEKVGDILPLDYEPK